MEGNQSRTVVNGIWLSMRSGKFWIWTGLLLIVAAVAGPYTGLTPAERHQEQRHEQSCLPVLQGVLSDETWRQLQSAHGYRELRPGELYRGGCESVVDQAGTP